ncbi:MAG: hypothetical protein KatS3mg090_0023 [Patescibacteria group bacterium]|nr:MAG: hypothetical protein KatS3mg090_0023 [Patescibacteria group bacterium]
MIDTKRLNQQSGQAMLLIVLVTALALSIIGAVIFDSITQTQITKLQEDSARALAVAEGLAEQALKEGVDVSASSDLGAFISAGNAVVRQDTSNEFKTPLLSKDDVYIVYLVDLGTNGNDISNNIRDLINGTSSLPSAVYNNFSVSVVNTEDFNNDSCPDGLVLELGFINLSGGSVSRKHRVIKCDPVSNFDHTLSTSGSPSQYSTVVKGMGSSFTTPTAHLMTVRVLYASTQTFPGIILKFSAGSNFPLQGITVDSTVRTTTGVTQTLTVFQSYPQIAVAFLFPNVDEN